MSNLNLIYSMTFIVNLFTLLVLHPVFISVYFTLCLAINLMINPNRLNEFTIALQILFYKGFAE